MAKVILRQKAIDDLDNIWFYTRQEWSADQADKYYATLKSVCIGLGKNPERGKDYSYLISNLLGRKYGKHIIFYQIVSEYEIEVIRILHERMDLKTRLTE